MSITEFTPVFSPDLEHLRPYEAQFNTDMARSVSDHKGSKDGFTPLEYDSANPELAFQRIDCIRVEGKGASPETFYALAESIYPDFGILVNYLLTKRADLLNHEADTLSRGVSINSVSEHRNVNGVAIVGAANICALYEGGYVRYGDIRTEIIVSTMLKNTCLLGSVPAVKLLAQAFNSTRFTIPSANSKNKDFLPNGGHKDFNNASTEDITTTVAPDNPEDTFVEKDDDDTDKRVLPIFRCLAGSGTRDKKVGRRFGKNAHPATIYMGPLAYGTVDLLKLGYNLPVGLDISGKTPEFYFGQLKQPVTEEVEADNIMTDIANGMSEASIIRRHYCRTRDEFNSATRSF